MGIGGWFSEPQRMKRICFFLGKPHALPLMVPRSRKSRVHCVHTRSRTLPTFSCRWLVFLDFGRAIIGKRHCDFSFAGGVDHCSISIIRRSRLLYLS
jgi:hypothetical protein